MTWFKVDDSFYDHPKVAQLPPRRWGNAVALWLAAGCYCARHLTDGTFTVEQLKRCTPIGEKPLSSGIRDVIETGLWRRNADGSLSFHDWEQYQPSRSKVLEGRKKSRSKKARQRQMSPGDISGPSPGVSPPPRPDPTRPVLKTEDGRIEDPVNRRGGGEAQSEPSVRPSSSGVDPFRAARGALVAGYQQRYESEYGDAWMSADRWAREIDGVARWCVAQGKLNETDPAEVAKGWLDAAWRVDRWRDKRMPWPWLAEDPAKVLAKSRELEQPKDPSKSYEVRRYKAYLLAYERARTDADAEDMRERYERGEWIGDDPRAGNQEAQGNRDNAGP